MSISEISIPQFKKGKHSALICDAYTSELNLEKLESIIESLVLKKSIHTEDGPRLGRGSCFRCTLDSGTRIIIRKYLRGGLFGRLLKDKFFSFLNSKRPFDELKTLVYLKENNISVVEPVAAMVSTVSNGLFYKGYLITKEVEEAENLLSLGYAAREKPTTESQDFIDLCYQAGREARKMLKVGVFHRDLHPGNVLFRQAKPYLIDFDRSIELPMGLENQTYLRRLLWRWKKSSSKHKLSNLADEGFEMGLYESIVNN